MSADAPDRMRSLLCRLGDAVRDAVLSQRRRSSVEELSAVAAVTAADTIFAIDLAMERVIFEWLETRWPRSEPVEIVMEGLADDQSHTIPEGLDASATRWKLILDPIDGTRVLMYDKRSAWSLAGLAPQRGPETNLSDIVAAAMTEIPMSKQWRADQLSAVKGCGPDGVVAEAVNVLDGGRRPFRPRPSQAETFSNGFAAVVKFFPPGKAAAAALEEKLWTALHPYDRYAREAIFDDQYLSTGGQFYEMAVGHDRMTADLRPLILGPLGLGDSLCCHPYDVASALVLSELGACVEAPDGRPLSSPLDTTTPVAWTAYANPALAAQVRPVLRRLLQQLDETAHEIHSSR